MVVTSVRTQILQQRRQGHSWEQRPFFNLKHGKKLTETQIQYLKMAAILKPKMVYALEQIQETLPIIEKKLDTTKKGTIRVEGTINPGTQIIIKEMSRIISEPVSRCKFVLNGADIKSVGI